MYTIPDYIINISKRYLYKGAYKVVYNISYESDIMQVESSSKVMEIIRKLRQHSKDQKAACIKIVTSLYNLDLWLLPIKNRAFLFFEPIGEKKECKGSNQEDISKFNNYNLISIEDAIRNIEYILTNNYPSSEQQWHCY